MRSLGAETGARFAAEGEAQALEGAGQARSALAMDGHDVEQALSKGALRAGALIAEELPNQKVQLDRGLAHWQIAWRAYKAAMDSS